jgi:anthranilate synthase/aminodeoxychorismate synthase-like glutamine amidotransferase
VTAASSARGFVLVVDHYDSFVYNLVQLVEGFGYATRIVRSDEASLEELSSPAPDAVLLSPGPGRPEDAGCFLELIRQLDDEIPMLGVCLGHQAIGAALGGPVIRAPEPVHGKASLVHHGGRGILAGLPDPFEAGRYHSLVVDRATLPPELEVTAETEDGLIMALQHRSLPRFGVQFHPESILTPHGPKIVENFLTLAGAGPRGGRVPAA